MQQDSHQEPPGRQLILIAKASLFYMGYLLATLIHAPICLVLGPALSFTNRYRLVNRWSQFIIWWLRVTCDIEYQIIGEPNLNHGPAIVISKHQSQWETFYLQLLFVPLVTVLKIEIMRVPLFGWALSLLEPIVIDRSKKRSAMKQIVDQGRKRLEQGISVLIFPEGTRTEPGASSRFSKGGFILAIESGFPIIPIAHNAGECWHPRQFAKSPGKITVVIGEPISTHKKSLQSLMIETRDWMKTSMYTISQLEEQSESDIRLPENSKLSDSVSDPASTC